MATLTLEQMNDVCTWSEHLESLKKKAKHPIDAAQKKIRQAAYLKRYYAEHKAEILQKRKQIYHDIIKPQRAATYDPEARRAAYNNNRDEIRAQQRLRNQTKKALS